jgi:2-phospho-L-lactate/phosphoenolpyruvate guanylyltransferase
VQWSVVVPVKALPRAKTRLVAASADANAHAVLVAAIRRDTLAAIRASAPVARLVLVSDGPGAEAGRGDGGLTADVHLKQTGSGLNEALREGEQYCRNHWPADGVAVLVGDLPALRPHDLTAALSGAAKHDRAFVADAAGTGTTLLTARPPVPLHPSFGAGSAGRHALIAVSLPAADGLRLDVDTAADLQAAAAHGVGPATTAVLANRPKPPAVHLDPA